MKKLKFSIVIYIAICFTATATDIPSLITVSADDMRDSYELAIVRSMIINTTGEQPTITIHRNNETLDIMNVHRVLFGTILTTNNHDKLLTTTQKQKLYIFPNPVSYKLQVAGLEKDVLLKVYDLQGKYILQSYGTQIDVSSIQPGIYMLKFDNSVIKFIKQ